jgi:hypothetical protein
MPALKKLFWIYFLLLIFEGALRKWVLPGFSAPLLLVRDPLAVLIIIEAHRTNKWPERWSIVMGALACALLGLCVWQMILGNNSWIAAVYGLRSYLLPFPSSWAKTWTQTICASLARPHCGLCCRWRLWRWRSTLRRKVRF